LEEAAGAAAFKEEQRFPVVDFGVDPIPDPLSEFSLLPHTPYTGVKRCFALVGVAKISKKLRGFKSKITGRRGWHSFFFPVK
jgi:hypothetical protein